MVCLTLRILNLRTENQYWIATQRINVLTLECQVRVDNFCLLPTTYPIQQVGFVRFDLGDRF